MNPVPIAHFATFVVCFVLLLPSAFSVPLAADDQITDVVDAARHVAWVPAPQEITFEELRAGLQDKSLTLIDVRTPEELHFDGRIPGSINIPLSELPRAFLQENADKFLSRHGIELPKTPGTNLVISCKSGRRALQAINLLRPLGYTDLILYKDSFQGWANSGGEYCKHGPFVDSSRQKA